MLQADVTAARWQQDSDGAWLCLRVQSPRAAMAVCDELQPDKQYVAQIKRKGRSLDANAYAWVLMDKLAAHYRLNPEDIYREKIKQIPGVRDVVGKGHRLDGRAVSLKARRMRMRYGVVRIQHL